MRGRETRVKPRDAVINRGIRHPGAGRDPVCFFCNEIESRLDPGLRRDDEYHG
jgi:hypothetical protein